MEMFILILLIGIVCVLSSLCVKIQMARFPFTFGCEGFGEVITADILSGLVLVSF